MIREFIKQNSSQRPFFRGIGLAQLRGEIHHLTGEKTRVFLKNYTQVDYYEKNASLLDVFLFLKEKGIRPGEVYAIVTIVGGRAIVYHPLDNTEKYIEQLEKARAEYIEGELKRIERQVKYIISQIIEGKSEEYRAYYINELKKYEHPLAKEFLEHLKR